MAYFSGIQQMMAPSNTIGNVFQRNDDVYHNAPQAFLVTGLEGEVLFQAEIVKDLLLSDPQRGIRGGFHTPFPVFPMAVLHLEIPFPDQQVEVFPAASINSRSLATTTFVTAVLQPATELRVEWRDQTTAVIPAFGTEPIPVVASASAQPVEVKKPRLFVDHAMLFSVAEGVISAFDQVNIRVEQAPISNLIFSLGSQTDVVDVPGTDIAAWNVQPEGDRQLLHIRIETDFAG